MHVRQRPCWFLALGVRSNESLACRFFLLKTPAPLTVQTLRQIRPRSPVILDTRMLLGIAKPEKINSLVYRVCMLPSECPLEHCRRSMSNRLRRMKHDAGVLSSPQLADRIRNFSSHHLQGRHLVTYTTALGNFVYLDISSIRAKPHGWRNIFWNSRTGS